MRYVAMALFWLSATAAATAPILTAPPDRVVAPGAYATLVFRVEARAAGRATATVQLPDGWRVVRTPDVVDLEAGRSTPVALTVGVPATAAAGAVERVGLRVESDGAASEQSVALTVAAAHGISLDAPSEFALGAEALVVEVGNTGNVLDSVDITLLRVGQTVASRRLEVPAGTTASVAFDVPVEGSYVVTAASSGGPIERRNVAVVRFGGPDPAPFALAGEARARATVGPTVAVAFALTGPLSDAVSVDAWLEPSALERTHLELRGDAFTVRLGPGWRDRFLVGLPSDTILAGTLEFPEWTAGAVLAGAPDAPTLAAVAVGRTWPGGDVAAALGWQRDDPWVSLRGTLADDGWKVGGTWRSEGGSSAWRVEAESWATLGTTTLDVGATGLGSERSAIALGAQHEQEATRIYGRLDVPLSVDDAWAGHIGATTTFTEALPGDLRVGAQLGNLERRFRVEYRGSLPTDWRTLVAVDARADARGFDLGGEARWVQATSGRYTAHEVRVDYASTTGSWATRLASQHQREVGPWTWTVGAAWDHGTGRVVARADGGRRVGDWRIGIDGSIAYGYATAAPPWSAALSLQASYAFTWGVPEAVTASLGGRSLGVVEGVVASTGPPLAGVRVDVGPYRLLTDVDGRFEIALPPGDYEFHLDATSVPAAHRLVDAAVRWVAVQDGRRVPVAWQTLRTTVLDGIVREPADAETTGAPPQGVQAVLRIVDAEGLRRSVLTDADGRFQLRGLVPGAVLVQLVDLPLGAVIVGASEQTLELVEGEPALVEFVVEPARARAQSFTERAVRIRSATVERDRVPPGSAPIVRVEVAGEPDSMELRLEDTTVSLDRSDGAWTGRLPLSDSLPDGPLRFTVVALADGAEATRRAQVEIAADAPVLEVTTDAPIRRGDVLTVEVHAVVELAELVFSLDADGTVAFQELEDGRWTATFTVPEGTEVGIREASIVGVSVGGAPQTVMHTFRILDQEP